MTWNNWVSMILGLAVIGVAFLSLSATTMTWTLVVLGLVIAAVGFLGVAREEKDRKFA